MPLENLPPLNYIQSLSCQPLTQQKAHLMNKLFNALSSLLVIFYAVMTATYLLYTLRITQWSVSTALIVIPAILFYPFLLTLIPAALGSAAILATKKLSYKSAAIITGSVLWVTGFILHCLLLLDAGLYFRYGYHINPHVINIFTTPGGFEGMGMRPNEITLLALGLTVLFLLHGAVIWIFMHFEATNFLKIRSWKFPAVIVPCFGLLFAIQFFTYAYAHYTMNPQPLLASDAIALYIKGTCKSMFKAIGIPQPERDAVRISLGENVHLSNYPQNPVTRNSDRKKFNVVWIACESFAARLFTPEIMPATAEFARKGVYFANHYSGGNVTRQGMFSMFYALPGNYWHAFLNARRGPLFIDWLLEDGYQIRCITSSKFSYPEFDQTIFFNIPQEYLHSDAEGLSYQRDQRNLRLLLQSIADGADSGNPFFSFMFFESTHHPYSFPPESVVFSDYIDPFNAVQTTAADAPAIFRRAANCARHLDMCLAQVFQLLESRELLDDTIVIIAGDHGEEYYEKGYLGHSSAFNNEQTRTPLIIYYPGITPQVYTGLSSHLDIVPMLAKLFGVENPAADYSCGMDLLAPDAPQRRYAIIANWDQVFFAGHKYKSLIPLNAASFAAQTITDADDRELPDVAPFYAEYNADLITVQNDLTRFTAPQDGSKSSVGIWIFLAISAVAAAICGAVIFIRRRKVS